MIYHNDIYEFRVVRIFLKKIFPNVRKYDFWTKFKQHFIHVYLDNGKKIPWKGLLMVPPFFYFPGFFKNISHNSWKKGF